MQGKILLGVSNHRRGIIFSGLGGNKYRIHNRYLSTGVIEWVYLKDRLKTGEK